MAPPLAAPRFHAGSPPQKLPSWPNDEVSRSRGAALVIRDLELTFGLAVYKSLVIREYTASLESLINVLAPDKLSIVFQGYFAPILPSTLACFSNFLLGEIFPGSSPS
ncbi:hypothetical protein GUJ93_ZPchr0019g2686 [Zizania palustris]|uniref:Uncharacterized protein n=1 Tax=Zizania palustris TaxID=103762 RepID=A0A8J5VRI6_ZIZPA|nr:hypothetical protein GUJ93_ZPchr0019g2686 [Zizania palustris]